MAAQQQLGVTVAQPPTDGVTRVRWSPGGKLMATSWDQVRAEVCLIGACMPGSITDQGAWASLLQLLVCLLALSCRLTVTMLLVYTASCVDCAAIRRLRDSPGHVSASSACAGRLFAR
jgi:hypothetical protein